MKAILFLLTSYMSAFSFAANIYVAPVQGTNIGEEKLKTIRELIKVQVQNLNEHRLVHRLEKSDMYLQTKLIKLNSYTLSMTKWKANNKLSSGNWSSKDLAGLETVLSTAVPEIINKDQGQKKAILFDNSKSLGEQAAEKKQHSNFERVQAGQQVMIGFGPAYFSNMNTSKAGLGFQAGYMWNIDDHFDLGLQSEFAISTEHSDAFSLNGKIVTNYFLMRKDISPFIGAGFGYGWASVHNNSNPSITDDKAGGFALSLQAGLKFFRTSNVNFAISGQYTNIFDKSSLGQPGIFLINAALYY